MTSPGLVAIGLFCVAAGLFLFVRTLRRGTFAGEDGTAIHRKDRPMAFLLALAMLAFIVVVGIGIVLQGSG